MIANAIAIIIAEFFMFQSLMYQFKYQLFYFKNFTHYDFKIKFNFDFMVFYYFFNFNFHYCFTQLMEEVEDLIIIDLSNFLRFFNFIIILFFNFMFHFAEIMKFMK